jgi:hypothetical protein
MPRSTRLNMGSLDFRSINSTVGQFSFTKVLLGIGSFTRLIDVSYVQIVELYDPKLIVMLKWGCELRPGCQINAVLDPGTPTNAKPTRLQASLGKTRFQGST